jgi:hypothetical protein
MDDALRVVVEMHECLWGRLNNALEDLGEEEINWRRLPQANTINVIIRRLRIEAQWHLDSLERGEPMPTIAVAVPKEAIDAVPLDFEENLKQLEELYTRFLEFLRMASLATLQQRTAAAYGEARRLTYTLGYTRPYIWQCTVARYARFATCTGRRAESRRDSIRRTPRIRTSRGPSSMAATKSTTPVAWPCCLAPPNTRYAGRLTAPASFIVKRPVTQDL